MPAKISTADRIMELCEQFGVSIFLDGSDDSDTARIGSPYSYNADEKILTIYLVNLRPNTWEKLKPYLKKKWNELGFAFDNEREEVLESVIEYANDDPHAELIDTFAGKIPTKDLTVLKLALYLRDEKEKGRSIEQFKQEIWEKFGERGAYISSLCNSGYFEEDFTRAANEMTDIEFDNYYDSMVDKELKAIFVHSGLKAAGFRDKFEDTFLRARKYNIRSFRIHGFGSWNVKLITTFFDSYQNDDDGLWDEFSIKTIEHNQYPPSVIYEIVLK